jgi:hypothetical protein
MDVVDSRNNQIEIPPDDDRVEQALLELDSRLDAWAAVILQTEAELKEFANAQRPISDSEIAGSPDDNPDDNNENNNITDAPSETAAASAPVVEDPTPTAPAFDLDKVLKITPTNKNAPPPKPEADTNVIEIKTDDSKKTAKDDAAEKQMEKEESLLASLEPEMAKKVQVLRRLSNKQKSVQELIDQVKASSAVQPAEETKTKKRSFWRLG